MTRVPLAAVSAAPLAHIDEFGYIHFGDGSRLEWWVLGDDYWHVPRASASLRQRSVDHTPVIETTIRVPGGDISWRAAVVAGDTGPEIVVECDNRGTLPVAIAVARVDRQERVTADIAPVAHKTVWRRSLAGSQHLPDLAAVAKGWEALARQGAGVITEDPSLDEALVAARCSLLLHAGDLTAQGRKVDKQTASLVANALTMLDYEDEAGALRRAARLKPTRKGMPLVPVDATPTSSTNELAILSDPAIAAATAIAVRNMVVADRDKAIDVLPGYTEAWRGRSIEVTALPTNHGAISFAVRWHGDKPALLWEAHSPLCASAISKTWSSAARSGEELVV